MYPCMERGNEVDSALFQIKSYQRNYLIMTFEGIKIALHEIDSHTL